MEQLLCTLYIYRLTHFEEITEKKETTLMREVIFLFTFLFE